MEIELVACILRVTIIDDLQNQQTKKILQLKWVEA
jgi:hypothetical protein